MDKYFIWYLLSEAEKVRFAIMKLAGQASQYWTNVKTSWKARFLSPMEIWFIMKY